MTTRNRIKSVLILSICYLPNIGGVETHIKDLITELVNRKLKVILLTYQPINTPVLGKWVEKSKNVLIIRLPIVRGLFYRLVDKPFFEFLYLLPTQFIAFPIVLLLGNPDVVNAQGIVSGFTSVFWSRLFRKRVVTSLQNIYHFPKRGLYRSVATLILSLSNKILVQSEDSKNEITKLGISDNKIIKFTHWENTAVFRPVEKNAAKEKIGFSNKFIVAFFGRLVDIKGVPELLEAISISDKNINFLIYGEGPLKKAVLKATNKFKNVFYMGIVPPEDLPLNYSAADLVIMPSTHDEGFGRVAVGSLLCGTPVVASDRGQLPNIVNDKVGKVINVSKENIAESVNYFYKNRGELNAISRNTRKFAVEKYSGKNIKDILLAFSGKS